MLRHIKRRRMRVVTRPGRRPNESINCFGFNFDLHLHLHPRFPVQGNGILRGAFILFSLGMVKRTPYIPATAKLCLPENRGVDEDRE